MQNLINLPKIENAAQACARALSLVRLVRARGFSAIIALERLTAYAAQFPDCAELAQIVDFASRGHWQSIRVTE